MSAPYTVRLDQEAARQLAQRGATLLLLGVPEGAAVGIDQQTFLVGPRFKGVKMLPPGPHVLSYSAASGQGDFGATTCFFLFLKSGQVVVRRWDAREEILREVDEDEAERYATGVRNFEFDSALAPYDLHAFNAWRRLSGHISAAVIEAVQPLAGNINILAEEDPAGQRPATAAEQALSAQLQEGRERAQQAAAQAEQQQEQQQQAAAAAREQPQQQRQQPQRGDDAMPDGNAPAEGREAVASSREAQGGAAVQQAQAAGADRPAPHAGRCYYTTLPRLVKRAGLTPAELTSLNLDKSPLLDELLASKYRGSEEAMLGEFQFAFLAFLLGQSLEGFAQWRSFLALLLGCEVAALGARAGLFARFLEAFHAQLEHSVGAAQQCGASPGGGGSSGGGGQGALLGVPLLWEELLKDSFLRQLTTRFLATLHEERGRVAPELAQQAQRVGGLVHVALGWGVGVVTELGGGAGSEEDEDAPVVVEEGEAWF